MPQFKSLHAGTKELTCLNDQRTKMPTIKTINKKKQMQPNKEFKITKYLNKIILSSTFIEGSNIIYFS